MLTQDLNQIIKGLKLVHGRKVYIEIADEGDSDALIIHAPSLAVRSSLLLYPPWSNFYLTVALPHGAVVNYKMVAKAIPESPVLMRPVHKRGISYIGGCMVNDDILPLVVRIDRNDVPQHLRIRDDELLTYLQRSSLSETIGGIDLFNGNIIHPGKPPDRLERPHLMRDISSAAEILQRLLDNADSGSRRRRRR